MLLSRLLLIEIKLNSHVLFTLDIMTVKLKTKNGFYKHMKNFNIVHYVAHIVDHLFLT